MASISCNIPNFIPCADRGCMHPSQCCNSEVSGWYCPPDSYCYTINNKIDCYSTTEPVPTVTIRCVDYKDSGTGCTGTTSCRTCVYRKYPSCYTEVVVGPSFRYIHTQVGCSSTGGISTVYATAQAPVISITPAPSSNSQFSIPTLPPADTNNQISPGAIAGIVIGGFVALALVLGGAWFLCGRNRNTGGSSEGQGVMQRGLGGPGGGGAGMAPPHAVEVEGHPAMTYYAQQYGAPGVASPPMSPIHGGYADGTKAS